MVGVATSYQYSASLKSQYALNSGEYLGYEDVFNNIIFATNDASTLQFGKPNNIILQYCMLGIMLSDI